METQPPSQKVGVAPQFSAHVYCGQTAGWIKMALGMEVGLGPVHIVLVGDTAPSPKTAEPPIFGPSLLWPNGWMHQDAIWYGGRPQPRRLCVRCGPSPLPQKGGALPNFRPRILWPNGCMDQDATWYGGRPRPTRHCLMWTQLPQKKRHTHPTPTQFLSHVCCGWMDEDAAWYGSRPRPRQATLN